MLDFPFAFAAGGSVANVLLPAAGAGACFFTKDGKSASYISGACLALSGAAGLAALVRVMGDGETLISAAGGTKAAFRLDGAGAFTITLSALTCSVLLGTEAAPRARSCAALLLGHTAVAAAALTPDLFTAALYLTVHAAALAVMSTRDAPAAALSGALTRQTGNAFVLFGAGLMFLYGGDLAVLAAEAAEGSALSPAFLTGAALAAAGLWLRAGLPPAKDGDAETATSSNLGALTAFRLPALLCLWRLVYGLRTSDTAPPLFAEALLLAGTAAACRSAFEALRGGDMRRAFSYWAQSFAGTAVALSAGGTPEAMSAAFLCMLHTALLCPALFAACACLRAAAGGQERLQGWRSAASYAPASVLLLLAGLLMAAGLPGGAGAILWRLAASEWTDGRYAAALALAAPQIGAAALTIRLWFFVRPMKRCLPPTADGVPYPRASFAGALALLTVEAALYVIPASAERLADAAARALF